MQLYADRSSRRVRQVVADVVGVVWVVGALWTAQRVHDLVSELAGPGESLQQSGTGLAESLGSAGERVDGVPLVGDALAAPFESAAGAASALADAGQRLQDLVADIALVLALLLVFGALFMALVLWVWPRLRWMRRAGAARGALSDPDGADLLALRALATRPLRELAVVGGDGVLDRWRRGDAPTIRALATLELGDLGLDTRRLPPDAGPATATTALPTPTPPPRRS
jgi:hypothetical protein